MAGGVEEKWGVAIHGTEFLLEPMKMFQNSVEVIVAPLHEYTVLKITELYTLYE